MNYLFLISFATFVLSCSNEREIKPADIKYGQDICHACSMIISEKEYSAQYVLKDGRVRKFDDIGCMMHYLNNNKPEGDIAAIFVRDYSGKNWINADTAHFIHSDKITTPMGHGIIALSTKEDFENIRPEIKAEYLGKFSSVIEHVE